MRLCTRPSDLTCCVQKKIGTMASEVPQGEFGEAWWKVLHDTFTLVDIGEAVSTLFAVKDKQEQVMNAASAVCDDR